MKYSGLPFLVWKLYIKSYKKNLNEVLNIDKKEIKEISKKSLVDYKKILDKLPTFDSKDRFEMNIVFCAMFIAFLLNLKTRPSLDDATKFYDKAMRTKLTAFFCKVKGKAKFEEKTIKQLQLESSYRCADKNDYSWNFDLIVYPDGTGYEARFTKCGICKLMREYGFGDLTPAMCYMDYTMSDLGLNSTFIREHTLATGGPYCDNGYKKK